MGFYNESPKEKNSLHLIMRLDKFIWAVRIHKTRSLASKACSAEKVKLNGEFAKSSKIVSSGLVVSIKANPIWRSYKVIDLPKSRVGAKLISRFIIETTSPKELYQLEQNELINRQNKFLGIKGRPTKKDRRDLDKLGE